MSVGPAKRNRIEKMVDQAHNPALADGMHVYVLFDDGELCGTKGGPLLWARTLHMMAPSLNVSFGRFPVERGRHTCAFVTEDDGTRIIKAMREEYPKITGKLVPSNSDLYDPYRRNLVKTILRICGRERTVEMLGEELVAKLS